MDVLPRDPEQWGADLSKQQTIRAKSNIYPDGLPDAQQQALARRYADVFALFLKHDVERVTLWGLDDGDIVAEQLPDPRARELPAALGPRRQGEAGLRRGGRVLANASRR